MMVKLENLGTKIMAIMAMVCTVMMVMPTVSAGTMDGIGFQDYSTNLGIFNRPTERITQPMAMGVYPCRTPQMSTAMKDLGSIGKNIKSIPSVSNLKLLERIEPVPILTSPIIRPTSMPKIPSIPRPSLISDTTSHNLLKSIERNFIKSIPDPAMEYNAIKFVEDLYKHQDVAMSVGSLITGNIPVSISGASFNTPFDLSSLRIDPVSTGVNFLRSNELRKLQNMKQDVLKPKMYETSYTLSDHGIHGHGNIKIKQQWTPGGDFGTLRREISHTSIFRTNIPDLSYSRPQINQFRSISTPSYGMSPSFSSFPRY